MPHRLSSALRTNYTRHEQQRMSRRRTARPHVDRETARNLRLDWSRGPSAHGARYPLKRPVSGRLARPLIRLVPFALLLLLMWTISRGFMASREARLWKDIQIAHAQENTAELDKMESFLSRYPGSKHVDDVSYYYASLGHRVRGCAAVEPVWRRVLDSNVSHRVAEAAVQLGECALDRGDTSAALDYLRRAIEARPVSAWTAQAALNAGRISDHNDSIEEALGYYRSLWALPSTIHDLREASHRIGEIYFDSLSVFRRQYRVQSGEVLWRIARGQGVTIEALLASNPHIKNPAQVEVGTLISIPLRGFTLLVSLEDRALYLRYGDQAIRPYPIAIGAPETPTPVGEFEVSIKEARAEELRGLASVLDVDPGEIGAGWLGFGAPPKGLHGGATSGGLRTATTPGTIQLLDEDLAELTQLVPRGTPLVIAADSDGLEWYPAPNSR